MIFLIVNKSAWQQNKGWIKQYVMCTRHITAIAAKLVNTCSHATTAIRFHEIQCNPLTVCLCLSLVTGISANTIPANQSDICFKDARIVWHLRTLEGSDDNPMTLQRNGRIEVGQMLEGDQADNSRLKGGDRYVAAFTGQGWLSLDINRANSLRLDGDSISLYMWILLSKMIPMSFDLS